MIRPVLVASLAAALLAGGVAVAQAEPARDRCGIANIDEPGTTYFVDGTVGYTAYCDYLMAPSVSNPIEDLASSLTSNSYAF